MFSTAILDHVHLAEIRKIEHLLFLNPSCFIGPDLTQNLGNQSCRF